MTVTEIYIKYTQYKLYICYTSHNILFLHYSLQSLDLLGVHVTSNSVRHLLHYMSTASQLKKIVLRNVRERVSKMYVHK